MAKKIGAADRYKKTAPVVNGKKLDKAQMPKKKKGK